MKESTIILISVLFKILIISFAYCFVNYNHLTFYSVIYFAFVVAYRLSIAEIHTNKVSYLNSKNKAAFYIISFIFWHIPYLVYYLYKQWSKLDEK